MDSSNVTLKVNSESASTNFNKLVKSDFNLEELSNSDKRCAKSYGSGSKEAYEMEELLSKYPRWNDLKDKLIKGCDYHLDYLSEDQRLHDLRERIERVNHKSAREKTINYLETQ